jgi:hypothetical protein
MISKTRLERPQRLAEAVRRFAASNASYDLLDQVTDGTWLAGGCGILASALVLIIGEEEARVLIIRSEKGTPQHLGVEFDGVIIDGAGGHTSRERWLASFEERESMKGCSVHEISFRKILDRQDLEEADICLSCDKVVIASTIMRFYHSPELRTLETETRAEAQ